MPVARPEPLDTRVIAHVDLDCFYVQVEQRRHPELKGKPTAVVMYNPWKGGGIIAVGYEARGAGVTRNMRGDDARKVCPDINLIQVPTHFGKADLTVYRDAGSEVVAVFSRGGVCERASIDEVYLDVTEAAAVRLQQCPPDAVKNLSEQVLGTHIVGLGKDHDERLEVKDWLCRSGVHASRSDQLLACGAMIIAELRTAVREETGFTTSAGIAHNKMLAKLASGIHKPAQQTLIPSSGAPGLLASLPIKKIKGLGGKLGNAVETDLQIKTIGDLLPYSESKLQDLYGTNTGTWLWRVARGMSGDEVEGRILPKSHGCGKTFPGPKSLKDLDSVAHWLSELSGELQERLDLDLEQNNRTARLLVCHAACHLVGKEENSVKPFPSKSCGIRYGKEKIASDALVLFKRALSEFSPNVYTLSPAKGENASTGRRWGVTSLSISASNIIDASGTVPITQFFAASSTASASHIATSDYLVSITTPPPSPSTLHSSPPSPLAPLCPEDSAQQERFGMKSFQMDKSCIQDLDVTNSTKVDSGTSESISGESSISFPLLDSLFNGGVQSRQPSAQLHYDHATTTEESLAPFSAVEVSEQVHRNARDRNSLELGGLTLHGENSTDCERAHSRPENEAVSTKDNETSLICTPKFGVPGCPIQPLPALNFPEDLSLAHSCDSTEVGRSVDEHQVLLSEKLDYGKTQILAQEVISCSPLEHGALQASKGDSRCGTIVKGEGNVTNSGKTTFDGVWKSGQALLPDPESGQSRMISLGTESSSVPDGAYLEDVASLPSPATQTSLEIVTINCSQMTPNQCKKGDLVTSGSSPSEQVVPTGSSKRRVFQTVDELWGKSRPSMQLSPSAKRSGVSSWNYKQEEIDECVLSELPVEIQNELRKQLGLKRPKSGRRATISDFFRTGLSPPK